MLTNQEMLEYTLRQIENLYLDGRISYAQLVAFVWLWRNCKPRKSNNYRWIENYPVQALSPNVKNVLFDIKNAVVG